MRFGSRKELLRTQGKDMRFQHRLGERGKRFFQHGILRNWQQKERRLQRIIEIETREFFRGNPHRSFISVPPLRNLVQARVRDIWDCDSALVLESGLIYRIRQVRIPHIALIYKEVRYRNRSCRVSHFDLSSWAVQLRLEGATAIYHCLR